MTSQPTQSNYSSTPNKLPTQRILGIEYFVGPVEQAVEATLNGGWVVAPSGPGMAVDLVTSTEYRDAVTSAEVAITDSGYMVLLWRLFTGQKLPRLSGLRFLRALLDTDAIKTPGATFWVLPNQEEDSRNRAWLNQRGFNISDADVYHAPFYGAGPINDAELVKQIEQRRPRVVMLCIGGGVQERVGLHLRHQLSYRPGITCLGAAIAFLTGGQTNIPPWGDRLFLGWLLRILSDPRRYGPRYYHSFRLAPLLFTNRDRLPKLSKG